MSDRTAGERPPGTPSQRALGAMESAVRRARERAGVATGTGPMEDDTQPVSVSTFFVDPHTPPVAPGSGPLPPGSGTQPDAPHRAGESARRERWLIISVAAVGALVVSAGVALAVSSGRGGPQGASPPAAPPPTTAHAATPPAHHQVSGHHGRTAASSTTTSTAPPVAAGPPVIASLSPASGSAGQGIEVAGSNFLSSSGQIVATFNGQVAPTSCPAPNACTVTVPPMSGSRSAQVTITTAGGTSNAVTFTYS